MTKERDPAQFERFKETARELGCDDDEAAFDEMLKVIARHKPKTESAPDAKKAAPRSRRPSTSS